MIKTDQKNVAKIATLLLDLYRAESKDFSADEIMNSKAVRLAIKKRANYRAKIMLPDATDVDWGRARHYLKLQFL